MTLAKELKNTYASLYSIDRTLEKTDKREIKTEDATSFVQDLLQETYSSTNYRMYQFKSETSHIYTYINEIYHAIINNTIEDIFDQCSAKIANRLLIVEKKTEEKYTNMNKPQKGGLIITYEGNESGFNLTLAKIETANFLEEMQLTIQSGLPTNKRALKTARFLVRVLEEPENPNEILDIDIIVTDSTSTIAKYWVEDFVEGNEVNSDTKNTKVAFSTIETILSRSLKKQAPSDYTELRNNLVGYFKTQLDYHHDNMKDYVFGNYPMENQEIDLVTIIEKVNKEVGSGKFDSHFRIVSKEIKARFKKTYKISEEIELRTNGHIEGLRHIIKATENQSGDKILEIKITDSDIYNQFTFSDTEQED